MATSASTSDAAPAAPPPAGDAGSDSPAGPDGWQGDLASLRAELDSVDDAIHDLLMRRAEVVGYLAASRFKTPGAALRPGREASIIRRLLARHHGELPPSSIVRIWRELLAATTGMQGAQTIAVCETAPAGGFTQVAREHFGALTALRAHSSPAQALADVSTGNASAAVLPLPSETDTPAEAWWLTVLYKDAPRLHIIARLPFWAPRGEGAPTQQAMVVAAFTADPSGSDRTLLGLELALDVSRARLTGALTSAGLPPSQTILRRDPGSDAAHALVEVDGALTEDDPRLASLGAVLHRPILLGTYAVPVAGAPQNGPGRP